MDNTPTTSGSQSIASIDMDLLSLERPSSRASATSSSSGVYIPVHRRKLSNTGSPMSSVPSSPASSTTSFASADVPIYSVEDLLLMSHSRLPNEERAHMREVVPEIYMNRKMRDQRERRAKHASGGKTSRPERERQATRGNAAAGSWRRI
ncbi:hypothetical protein HWV62_35402 [Athelia sp. TMB]|nr:hypothetical protein HWV62_35402 [Athelia sp. TMB]